MFNSSSQFSLEFVKSFFDKIFTNRLRKTQFTNLCLSVFGLIGSQSGLLSEIVREFPLSYSLRVKHKHRLKRLSRFLANVRFRPEGLFSFWVVWCSRQFARGEKLLIALDWTTLPGNYQCLMAAIPFFGRAIPLYFRLTTYREFEKSQNLIEESLVKNILKLLPKEIKPILVADRGFGRAKFFQFLKELKVDFVIRVRSEVWVTLEARRKDQKIRRKLSRMKLKPNRSRWYESITYREDGLVNDLNLAATIAQGSLDPWFLITSLKEQKTVIDYYEQRFQIEEFFKDTKHQLGLTNLQTKDQKKIYRLLFLACLAYGLLSLIGKKLEKFPEIQAALITGGRKAASIIWLALKTIDHQFSLPTLEFQVLTDLGP